MTEPELTDDAVVELAREGGFAWIPKLAAPRRFIIASVPIPLRERLRTAICLSLPEAKEPEADDSPGRGDQFYYRIHISYSDPTNKTCTDVMLLIPEPSAPMELEELWRNGLPERNE